MNEMKIASISRGIWDFVQKALKAPNPAEVLTFEAINQVVKEESMKVFMRMKK